MTGAKFMMLLAGFNLCNIFVFIAHDDPFWAVWCTVMFFGALYFGITGDEKKWV